MKKLFPFLSCLLITLCFFWNTNNVKASMIIDNVNITYQNNYVLNNINSISVLNKSFDGKTDNNISCEGLLGSTEDKEAPAYWLQFCLNVIKYAGIIALLCFSTLDFLKALTQDDKDALKKATTTTVKRFVYAILLFFLPIIVDVLMKLVGAYGTCGIG